METETTEWVNITDLPNLAALLHHLLAEPKHFDTVMLQQRKLEWMANITPKALNPETDDDCLYLLLLLTVKYAKKFKTLPNATGLLEFANSDPDTVRKMPTLNRVVNETIMEYGKEVVAHYSDVNVLIEELHKETRDLFHRGALNAQAAIISTPTKIRSKVGKIEVFHGPDDADRYRQMLLLRDWREQATVTEIADRTIRELDTYLIFLEAAAIGVLRDLAKRTGIPIGLIYPALLTVFSAIPREDEMCNTRLLMYTCLMAGVGGGKDEALKAALRLLRMRREIDYLEGIGASANGLALLIGDRPGERKSDPRKPGMKKALLVEREFDEFLRKAAIKGSTLITTINTLFDDNHKILSSKEGRSNIDCRMSILGNIPVNEQNPEQFGELFGASTMTGFTSRLIFGYSGGKCDYNAIEDALEAQQREIEDNPDSLIGSDEPVPYTRVLKFNDEAKELCRSYDPPEDTTNRTKYYMKKIAILTASADAQTIVDVEHVRAAIAFMDWQIRVKSVFHANDGEDCIASRATATIMDALKRKTQELIDKGKTGDDLYINHNRIKNDLKWMKKFGASNYAREFDTLIRSGDLAYKVLVEGGEKNKPVLDKTLVKVNF